MNFYRHFKRSGGNYRGVINIVHLTFKDDQNSQFIGVTFLRSLLMIILNMLRITTHVLKRYLNFQ